MNTRYFSDIDYGSLRDIEDVERVKDKDKEVLERIASILKKHGKQDRFGVVLLHKHFEVAADEVVLEEYKPQERVVEASAISRADLPANAYQSMWKFK